MRLLVPPRQNTLVSSSGGRQHVPRRLDPADVAAGRYGRRLHFWDLERHDKVQTIDLGDEGLIPLEIRWQHDPDSAQGFVGATLSSDVVRFHRDNGSSVAHKVIDVGNEELEGSPLEGSVPGLITDLVLSLDDRDLFFSNWLHGDLRRYDVSDPTDPSSARRCGSVGLLGRDGGHPKASGSAERRAAVLRSRSTASALYVANSLFSTGTTSSTPRSRVAERVDRQPDGSYALDPRLLRRLHEQADGAPRRDRPPGGDCSTEISSSPGAPDRGAAPRRLRLCPACHGADARTGGGGGQQVLAALPDAVLRACGGTAPGAVVQVIRQELARRTPTQLAERIERRWHGVWANRPLRRAPREDAAGYGPDEVALWLVAAGECRGGCEGGWLPATGDPCPVCQPAPRRPGRPARPGPVAQDMLATARDVLQQAKAARPRGGYVPPPPPAQRPPSPAAREVLERAGGPASRRARMSPAQARADPGAGAGHRRGPGSARPVRSASSRRAGPAGAVGAPHHGEGGDSVAGQ